MEELERGNATLPEIHTNLRAETYRLIYEVATSKATTEGHSDASLEVYFCVCSLINQDRCISAAVFHWER